MTERDIETKIHGDSDREIERQGDRETLSIRV